MNNYVVVCWPESQMLMEKKGFRQNCELINSEQGFDKYGSSAYLVNEEWYEQFKNGLLEDDDEDNVDELVINNDFE